MHGLGYAACSTLEGARLSKQDSDGASICQAHAYMTPTYRYANTSMKLRRGPRAPGSARREGAFKMTKHAEVTTVRIAYPDRRISRTNCRLHSYPNNFAVLYPCIIDHISFGHRGPRFKFDLLKFRALLYWGQVSELPLTRTVLAVDHLNLKPLYRKQQT
jgi:hypothetical protein